MNCYKLHCPDQTLLSAKHFFEGIGASALSIWSFVRQRTSIAREPTRAHAWCCQCKHRTDRQSTILCCCGVDKITRRTQYLRYVGKSTTFEWVQYRYLLVGRSPTDCGHRRRAIITSGEQWPSRVCRHGHTARIRILYLRRPRRSSSPPGNVGQDELLCSRAVRTDR